MPKRSSIEYHGKIRITAAGPSPIFTEFPVRKSRKGMPFQHGRRRFGLPMLTKHPDNFDSNFKHYFFI